MLSYDVTSLNESIKKGLNRGRYNVGKTAYSDRVRAMLVMSTNKEIASMLGEDLKNFDTDNMHDELKWIDVQEHAV